jgi:hypothetical protein
MPSSNYQFTRVITPAQSMALISLDQAKDALGIASSDTSQNGILGRQIAQVSAAIQTYCDRIFVRQGYRDQFRYVSNWLDFGEPLRTRQYPIAADQDGLPVVLINEAGIILSVTDWEVFEEAGSLYRLDSAGSISMWTGQSITVDYDGGYDVIPDDIQAAAAEWLGASWVSRGRDPLIRSETIPDVITQVYQSASTSTSAFTIPGGCRDLLAKYMAISL